MVPCKARLQYTVSQTIKFLTQLRDSTHGCSFIGKPISSLREFYNKEGSLPPSFGPSVLQNAGKPAKFCVVCPSLQLNQDITICVPFRYRRETPGAETISIPDASREDLSKTKRAASTFAEESESIFARSSGRYTHTTIPIDASFRSVDSDVGL